MGEASLVRRVEKRCCGCNQTVATMRDGEVLRNRIFQQSQVATLYQEANPELLIEAQVRFQMSQAQRIKKNHD
jgi:hypothetical protein